jgi:hypothetical protein
MFSRDNKHNRRTPRTIQEAFGAYHRYDITVCRKHELLCLIAAALVMAGIGLLIGWRG